MVVIHKLYETTSSRMHRTESMSVIGHAWSVSVTRGQCVARPTVTFQASDQSVTAL